MSIEFTITICTMLVGFLGIILMIWQMNQQLNSRIESGNNSLRTEFKSDINDLRIEVKSEINRIETRFESDIKELRGLILGLYSPNLIDKINKKDAA